MKIIHTDLYGNETTPDTLPALSLVWHRNKYETYLYSAELLLAEEPISPIAEIIVRQRNVFIVEDDYLITRGARKGTVVRAKRDKKGFDIREIKSYLPYKRCDNCISVPLNSTNIIEALECNDWTLNQFGQRNDLKRHPVALSWKIGDEMKTFEFPYLFGYTPALLSEPHTSKLSEGDKINITLHLTL